MGTPYTSPRGTLAALVALATSGGIRPGQVYLVTDQGRLAVGLTTTSYELLPRMDEVGGGGAGSELLATANPTGSATIDFVEIPEGFKHLTLEVWFGKHSTGTTQWGLSLQTDGSAWSAISILTPNIAATNWVHARCEIRGIANGRPTIASMGGSAPTNPVTAGAVGLGTATVYTSSMNLSGRVTGARLQLTQGGTFVGGEIRLWGIR